VFVAGAPGVDRDRVLDMLTDMRREGISADADVMGRGLKAQMKQADRLRARLVMILGPDELERGEVTLRDLDSSTQWEVPVLRVVQRVTEYLAENPEPPACAAPEGEGRDD
jgi:histidyl-tRNA synthetase